MNEKKNSLLRIIQILLTVYVLYRLVNVILITGIYYAGQEQIKSDLAACGADGCGSHPFSVDIGKEHLYGRLQPRRPLLIQGL